MPRVFSRSFGAIDYVAGEPFSFPNGLPGFPLETAFLPIEVPEQLPLVYLQSLQTPTLCFVALPVHCIVPNYELSPNREDMARIGLGPDVRPGSDMLCLALLCFGEDGMPAANLRAPVIVNIKNRRAIQTIQSEDRYPIRFPLQTGQEVSTCS
jgi:flagellar assembly factor FliW